MGATFVDDWDVTIVGAGPAGCAAAISLARTKARVLLLEAERFPRHRAGESLHPGVEPLLERLGVADAVNAAGFIRHRGHHVQWRSQGAEHFEVFGEDERGEWLGYQAWRPEFDRILLEAARAGGATVCQPCRAQGLILEDERVAGLKTDRGAIRSRFLLDATGPSNWLTRKLRIGWTLRSSRLTARYGYVRIERKGDSAAAPRIRRDPEGWTWIAPLREDLCAWVRMRFDGADPGRGFVPSELGDLRKVGPSRGADVTWRIADELAGPGWFLLGDSAAVLDPASSHGVIRALMSGMQVGNLIAHCRRAGFSDSLAASSYSRWFRDWFDADVDRLRDLYLEDEVFDGSGIREPKLETRELTWL